MKDLAALNNVEMLPWDEWARMTDAYDGNAGSDYDLLLDELAEVCATDDFIAIRNLYRDEALQVPKSTIQ